MLDNTIRCYPIRSDTVGALEDARRTPALQKHLMAGTALMYAHMASKNVIGPAELNAQMAKSARFFQGVKSVSGRSFRQLQFLFLGSVRPRPPLSARAHPCPSMPIHVRLRPLLSSLARIRPQLPAAPQFLFLEGGAPPPRLL